MKVAQMLRLNARFWARVGKAGPSECWLWRGHLDEDGYGVSWNGIKAVRAHRHAWQLEHGTIPDGICVLHRCDVRNCVNPGHLFLGTNADNMEDKMVKGRHRAVKGELVGSARLSAKEVLELRRLRAAGLPLKELSARYCISQSQVSRIANHKEWRHLDAELPGSQSWLDENPFQQK